MKRRHFIKAGALFVPTIFVPRLIQAQANTYRDISWLINRNAPTANGPNVWYDVETFANTDTGASGTVDALEWSTVTVAQGGSATKARIYLADNSGGFNIKMGSYAAGGGSILASGVATVADGTCCDNAYLEVTFGTPVAVTATTYLIAWIVDSSGGSATYRFKASSGNWKSKLSYGYSSFPGTLPAEDFSLSRGYAVSLFVQ